ncbi:alcohol dehydrogenase [Nostoc linckia z18]|jgi:aryl-alcohol dehydrogenase-like predicted oxidoreductase|uniref:Alcohol dehydrogenase n=2 Tax=Nostoc linckia TaxID=92942 RepID=A0A9Q5ZHF0_NOSLI|nr:aldo/keto reductase [Nostoc linckia]PHK39178.1 alcohol dehydrogenase [Nostoc linckia z15]PHK46766.1 alcohol dehydrogenase [Nostoc linckia z16]PHJ69095.1 alcohol dehydrogenase [Nostoc linckia z1]PHJ73246.1 alcohol dehydrogenase [Nostoc linckia z3]PHJ78593.1 alcohol dehydrogenase [Nostoc linckia z2]
MAITERRKLGRSELEVSPISFGGNVFGWTIDENTSFEILDNFVAAGGNFIDTADVYSKWAPGNQGGESETILGKWLKQRGNRHQVAIATKVGSDMGVKGKGLSRKHIQQAVEDSLQRLQTDYIDLYQSHIDDENTPLEETLETYGELIRQGKIRAIGASNYSGSRLLQALEISHQNNYPRYESLQPRYNLYDRDGYEGDLQQIAQEYEIGVISYSSIASGFLSGKYRSEKDLSISARGSSIKKYLNPRGFTILEALDGVAKSYNATPTQISLAWLIANPSITAPIVSATNLKQLNDIIQAANLKLDGDAINLLNEASS